VKSIFLLGSSIAYSLSPVMHNAALRATGFDWHYALWDLPTEALPEAMAHLRTDECIGANVTIPHKETILRWLDGLGKSARDIRAVNTIVKRDGQLIGENTDAYGFIQALRDVQVDPRGTRAVILGAGGAARAVAFALGQVGVHSITICNRTLSRSQALAEDLRGCFPEIMISVNGTHEADLVLNALPPGVPFDVNTLKLARGAMAFDLTYRPMETPFMCRAVAAGARAVNGLGMLVHQAAAALELWTGRKIPASILFDAARQAMR
jgi:shikimate dehydrogenase